MTASSCLAIAALCAILTAHHMPFDLVMRLGDSRAWMLILDPPFTKPLKLQKHARRASHKTEILPYCGLLQFRVGEAHRTVMPKEGCDSVSCKPTLIVQAWLQEFAWTEAEKLQKWKTRAGNLRLTSAALHDLNNEPMFCFESAIKLYYYSHIIYQYHKVGSHYKAGFANHAASAQS